MTEPIRGQPVRVMTLAEIKQQFPPSARIHLSPRQWQVVALVAEAKSNKAIARNLGISVKRVEACISVACERIPGDGAPRHKIMRWWFTRAA